VGGLDWYLRYVVFPWGVPAISPAVEEYPSLPSAGPEYLGRIVLVRSGVKTRSYVCVRNSAGGYEWNQLSEST